LNQTVGREGWRNRAFEEDSPVLSQLSSYPPLF